MLTTKYSALYHTFLDVTDSLHSEYNIRIIFLWILIHKSKSVQQKTHNFADSYWAWIHNQQSKIKSSGLLQALYILEAINSIIPLQLIFKDFILTKIL